MEGPENRKAAAARSSTAAAPAPAKIIVLLLGAAWPSPRQRVISSAKALALGWRSAGAFASALTHTGSSARWSGVIVAGSMNLPTGGTGSLTSLSRISEGLSLRKGGRPAIAS